MSIYTNYTAPFVVRRYTDHRKVGEFQHIEAAETCMLKGRCRGLYAWDRLTQRYYLRRHVG